MKIKSLNGVRRCIWVLAFIGGMFFFSQVYGQSEAESEHILLLQSTKNKRPRYLKAGKKVLYRVKGGENEKGRLERITDSTLVVSGNELYPDELEMISGKSAGLKAAKTTGGVFIVVGAGGLAGAFAAFDAADRSNDCGQSFGYILLGLFLFTGGAVLLLLGLIPFAIRNKRYQLLGPWKLSITESVPRKKSVPNE